MSPGARMEYHEAVYLRYKKASRKEQTAILDELCKNCGYHRKHAIRALNTFRRFTKPKPKKRGNPSVYNKPGILEPLKRIWLDSNLPCSKPVTGDLILMAAIVRDRNMVNCHMMQSKCYMPSLHLPLTGY